MSEMSNEAIQAQIKAVRDREASKIKEGEDVVDASDASVTDAILYADSSGDLRSSAVTASKMVYVDSSSVPQVGDLPHEISFSGVLSTASAVLNFTGQSTGSADLLLQGTIVDGGNVTTFTKTGFLQVGITDEGGNVTDGKHYIQIGTLS